MSSNCKLSSIVQNFHLDVLNHVENYEETPITVKDINRPGIQLTGFFDYYDSGRIQIIGYVESMYLKQLEKKEKLIIYNKLMSLGAPCFIFCRNISPDLEFLEIATQKKIPVLSTLTDTSEFMRFLIKYLSEQLALSITIHGCLVDINGVGVFIQGESGIGKSEAVLELIKRGHRMVADDAVEIYKASEKTLYGRAPEIIKDFLEIRGIGLVDIKNMFGVQAVKETQNIELVVTIKEWKLDDNYDRIGDNETYVDILGNRIKNYVIPVRPGRNIAVILEAAALCYRKRQLGHKDIEIFMNRVNDSFK